MLESESRSARGCEKIEGQFVSMNPQFHNTAMKLVLTGRRAEGPGARFLSPFQGSTGWGFHPGFRRSGSTLGYVPAAASRLKVFAVL